MSKLSEECLTRVRRSLTRKRKVVVLNFDDIAKGKAIPKKENKK